MSENLGNKRIIKDQKVLILTEEDFHKKCIICSYSVDVILVPIDKKEEFQKCSLWVSLKPIMSIGAKVGYY